MILRRCSARGAYALAAVVASSPAYAQAADGFDLSGTIRLRYEAIANQPRAGFRRDDDLVNLRTTLLARYTEGPLTLATELWDSRVYGQKAGTPVTTGEVNAFEFVQAYARYALPLSGGGSVAVQAGRFLLNIGSRRLVAADDYRNTTNGYTGLEAVFDTPAVNATLVYVLPQQRRPDDAASIRNRKIVVDEEGFDQVLWGGTISRNHAIGDFAIEASYYHLGERDTRLRPTRDRSLDTYGGRVMRAPHAGKADIEIEAFRQTGEVSATAAPTAARLSVSAYFAHIDAGYTFRSAWQPACRSNMILPAAMARAAVMAGSIRSSASAVPISRPPASTMPSPAPMSRRPASASKSFHPNSSTPSLPITRYGLPIGATPSPQAESAMLRGEQADSPATSWMAGCATG